MTNINTNSRAINLVFALLFGLLAGCGGGGSTTSGSTSVVTTTPLADGSTVVVTSTTPEPVPEFVTVPQYKALRSTVLSVTGGVVPSANELAALVSANYKTAVDQLAPGLTPGNNAVVVPPLTEAVLRMVAAAASGDTLAQISSKFDVAPTPQVAAMQTGAVASQFWADKGRRFRTGFLAATDSLGPIARLSDWTGAETGFATDDFKTDPLLATAFTQLEPWLTVGHLAAPAKEIRMVAAHQVTAKAPWGAVVPFDGVFERGHTTHDLLRMPMVRVSDGVKRFVGSDFTADILPMPGGRHLLSLRPNTGTLAAFASTRLQTALAEAVQGALATGATLPAGDLVLPQQAMGFTFDARAPLLRQGVGLPFDEVNANFRNLDGLGGVYAQPVASGAAMQVGVDGLSFKATDVTAFTFSPKNIYGSGGGSFSFVSGDWNFNFGLATFDLFTCAWPTPNLRSFFLAVVDANRWVVSLAAIQGPIGTPVTPNQTAYNPWPNDPRWNINAALRGSIPESPIPGYVPPFVPVEGLVFVGAPPPPALPVPPNHSDVVAEAAQYGFVRIGDKFVHSSCDNR